MFEWISSLALVIFEVICCVMFFESFCKEQENWKKWHKYVLIGIQTAEFFACESCKEKRQIKFRFTREKDGTTILSVRNTYSRPIVFQQDELKTSKKDQPEEHGVGVKNIIKVVEKYNGSYVIQHDTGEFYISIIL